MGPGAMYTTRFPGRPDGVGQSAADVNGCQRFADFWTRATFSLLQRRNIPYLTLIVMTKEVKRSLTTRKFGSLTTQSTLTTTSLAHKQKADLGRLTAMIRLIVAIAFRHASYSSLNFFCGSQNDFPKWNDEPE